MHTISLEPIGWVVSEVKSSRDDHWGPIIAEVRLDEARFAPTALEGLEDFSHVEVLFVFDQVTAVENDQRHPRNNPRWPKRGIFAQRGRNRPNRIGATICEIAEISGLTVRVRGLDAFHGSPVLDIKPVMAEFLPDRRSIRQPGWSRELMETYF